MTRSSVARKTAGVLMTVLVLLAAGCGSSTTKIVRGDGDPMDPGAEFWVEELAADTAGNGAARDRAAPRHEEPAFGVSPIAEAPASTSDELPAWEVPVK